MSPAPYDYGNDLSGRFSRQRPPSQQMALSIALSIAWLMGAMVFLGVFGLAFYVVVPFSLVAAPLVAILLLAAAGEAGRHLRRQRAMTVLSYLEQAVRLNLPLPAWLASARQAEGRGTRRRLADLAEALGRGLPISASLRLALPELPDREVGLIGAAEYTGALSQALHRLLEENRRTSRRDPLNLAFYRTYPIAVALVLVVVLAGFSIFVMPKFEVIFRDFAIALPPITVFVLSMGATVFGPLAVLAFGVAMILTARAFGQMVTARSAAGDVYRGLTDRLLWYAPLAGEAARNRGLADVFQTLGDAVEAGLPLTRGLEEAGGLGVNLVLARKIAVWSDGAQGGLTPADAARAAGMPALVVGLLATAKASEDAAAVYRFLSRYYRTRFSRAGALLAGAFIPAVVLVLAACVCAVALAMFLPLVALIDHLAPYVGGI